MEYVYCIVPEDNVFAAPPGIDGAPVRRIRSERSGDIAALASSLVGKEFEPERIAERVGDAEWLAPRAMAHDALVTLASDSGTVIPLPMWVMFSDVAGVVRMLDERSREFAATLDSVRGAREFNVRVSADRDSLEAVAARMTDGVEVLEREAALSPPGHAYLLRRKIAELRKAAARDVAARVAEDTHARLSHLARASAAGGTALAKEPGVVLDAAYLVDNEKYDSFRSALTEVMQDYGAAGVRFDFTGPWPPYRFVRGD